LRKLATAVLAVPVVAVVYASLLLRRSTMARVGLTVGLCMALGLVTFGVATPAGSSAKPPTPIVPVATARFSSVLRVAQPLAGPVAIDFSGPMDVASVEGALSVEPPVAVRLAWSADRARLVVTPSDAWSPATYYTVTVGQTARSEAGAALASPARSAFLTRTATTARLAAVAPSGASGQAGARATSGAAETTAGAADPTVSPDATIEITFDRPVDVASVRAAFRITPKVPGAVVAAGDSTGDAPAGRGHTATTVRFVPSRALTPATTYTVNLVGPVTDLDGGLAAAVAPLTITVPAAPRVVRFRPLAEATAVAPDAAVSVRFTHAMDPRTTASALTVTVNGARVTGAVRWAEGGTVLVFVPAKAFPAGATVVASVSGAARSAAGVALPSTRKSTFTVEKPAPPAAPAKAAATAKAPSTAKASGARTTPIPRPRGSVAGNWHAVELYYLSLMNCTRTGGWVTSTGACSSPGGRDVAPLTLDAGISDDVSRPFAKLMVDRNVCSHFVDGNPGNRLSRAGYPSYRWAENIGCLSIDPYASMLSTHLFFQSEKSYGGGHYVNMMNPLYDRVGIGIWVSGGRLRLVIDFYHP
jgi:uncharacterized protein YkwD